MNCLGSVYWNNIYMLNIDQDIKAKDTFEELAQFPRFSLNERI